MCAIPRQSFQASIADESSDDDIRTQAYCVPASSGHLYARTQSSECRERGACRPLNPLTVVGLVYPQTRPSSQSTRELWSLSSRPAAGSLSIHTADVTLSWADITTAHFIRFRPLEIKPLSLRISTGIIMRRYVSLVPLPGCREARPSGQSSTSSDLGPLPANFDTSSISSFTSVLSRDDTTLIKLLFSC